MKDILNHWTDPVIQRGAVATSLAVGIVLILINKGFQPIFGPFTGELWLQVGLTFFVPYLVSIFSAVRTRLQVQSEFVAPEDGIYRCESCLEQGINHDIQLKKGETVPECDQSGNKGQFTLIDRSIS
mgnify:CR=1 FL=1